MGFEVTQQIWAAVTGTEPKGSSGEWKVLFLDLDVGYTDGCALDMFLSFTFTISAFFLSSLYFSRKDGNT